MSPGSTSKGNLLTAVDSGVSFREPHNVLCVLQASTGGVISGLKRKANKSRVRFKQTEGLIQSN